MASEGLAPESFAEKVQKFRPDVIHAHHALRAGALLTHTCVSAQQGGLAVVTSPGGTDINEDLEIPGKRETVLSVFQMARVIIAQSPEIIERFNKHLPDLSEKVFFVPKSAFWFGDEPYDLRGAAECKPDDILFFLPSGIRPVKGNRECLHLMQRVHAIRPKVRFVAAGPPIDNDYSARFEQEISELAVFARWIRTIPPAAMRSAYRASDIVLNTSRSEGLSNSIMEAIAAGRPVLASDIPGNRPPVLGGEGDSPAGLLFDRRSAEDFLAKALALIDDPALRSSLGGAGGSRQSRSASTEDEAEGLIAAYRTALDKS